MKILNIFGIVVAVHVAVFLLIFAIPGCRSTKPAEPAQVVGPEPTVSYPSDGYTPISSAPEMNSADLNPALSGGGGSAYGANSSRYSPTRPGTPVATALTPTPVADVVPAKTYTVVRGDSLWSIAKKHDISVRELAAANNLSASAGLKIDQALVIPGQVAAPAADLATNSAAPIDARRYTVSSGDTLGSIARRQGTTVADLKAINNLRSDLVRVGDTLLIPAAMPSATAAVTPNLTLPTSTSDSAPAPVAATAGGKSLQHTVMPGETLGGIARRYNVKVSAIAMANNIADPTKMRAGQSLTIPGATAPAPSTPAPAPAATANRLPSFNQTLPPAEQDLDAGLGDTGDVPVLDVVEPVRTISLDPEPTPTGSGAAPRID